MWRKKYEKWVNYTYLDETLRKELETLNEKEKEDAFYKDLSFGTGGLRATLGVGTNRLNIYTIRKNTEGYARWLDTQGEEAKARGVVVAYDNRHMSTEFATETAKVLAKHHIKIYVFDSLRPTPELSFAVRELNAFGGVVITASHNPPQYNGYKIYDETGCQCVLRYTNQIIKYINSVEDELAVEVANKEECQKYVSTVPSEIDERYYEEVLKIQLHPELDKSNLKIVFSPQHGTANVPVREVLKRAGYTVIPVESQCNPDPNFSNTKDPNPENKVAFEEGLKVAKETNADCIICTDPDCDRLGVMVKHSEDYVALTGNQTGAILLKYILEERTKLGTLPNNAVVFSTVVTSSLGDLICKKYGVKVDKTLTGFKFIGDKIHDLEVNQINTFLFGYEESYGYLISDISRDKDGVQSCLFISEVVNFYKKDSKTLVDVLNEIYQEYGHFTDGQKSIKMEGQDGLNKMNEILERFRNPNMTKIGDLDIVAKEDYKFSKRYIDGREEPIALPKSNVLKFFFADNSWIAIRPSGTEPKIKFYFFDRGNDLLKKVGKLLFN